jgi:hypothetical protein
LPEHLKCDHNKSTQQAYLGRRKAGFKFIWKNHMQKNMKRKKEGEGPALTDGKHFKV